MAYIGAEPVPGQNREIDDISSGFNGSATAFTLQVSSTNVSPESANNILVNLGGVMQNPGTDYTIAASTITFTTAPASGLSFWALILGAGINTATVADDTIGSSKLIDTAVTAGSYTTADITVDAQGRITAAASGTIANAEIADGAINNAKVNASAAIARTKLANVDLVDDTSPQLGGDLDTNDNAIRCSDSNGTNNQITFGDSNDLQIRHQSNSSYITNATGNLNIGSNNEIRIKGGSDVAESMAIFKDNGAVELYHDNTKRFETASYGVSTDGLLNFNGTGDKILIPDSGVISLGGGGDLKFYHTSGSANFIQASGGHANVHISNLHQLKNQDNNEFMLTATNGGGVELYNDNSKKFETTTTGTTTTGSSLFPDGSEIVLGSSNDLILRHISGSRHEILGAASAALQVRCDNQQFLSENGNENLFKAIKDGAVELYYDNVLKAETTSVGFNVQGVMTQETTGDDVVWGRQVFRDSIGGGATRTITLTGVIYGNATISLGYSDGNQQFVTYKALMGGAQYSLANGYTVVEQINSRSGVSSISVTKNNASFVIVIVAGSNQVFGSVVVESHNYNNNGRPTVAFS